MSNNGLELHKTAAFLSKINDDNGFDKPTWENIPTKVMMTITELDEARDAVLGRGKDPLEEELADTAIRLLSMLHSLYGDDWVDRVVAWPMEDVPVNVFVPVETSLWLIVRPLCQAVESWRKEERGDVQGWLEIALRETFSLADRIGVFLNNSIHEKSRKNAGRGKWHGKARSEG